MVKRLPLVAVALLTVSLINCKKKEDEAPPPPPATTVEPVPTPPPVAPSAPTTVNLQPVAPAPGQAPNTLGEAIMFAKPQMRDSTGAPDEGSNTLLNYWKDKKYAWAQLEAVPPTTEAAFLANPDAERGKRICSPGTVQQLNKTNPTPPVHEGMLTTQANETVSFGAVGDVTGIRQGGPGKFCGIATGIQNTTGANGAQVRAIRSVGMFDTPANRGGGGGGFGSLRACCQALQQNSVSMPPPQNMYAAAAAQYCFASVAAVSSPQQKDAMIAGIRGALRGAAMPGACRLSPQGPAPGSKEPGLVPGEIRPGRHRPVVRAERLGKGPGGLLEPGVGLPAPAGQPLETEPRHQQRRQPEAILVDRVEPASHHAPFRRLLALRNQRSDRGGRGESAS